MGLFARTLHPGLLFHPQIEIDTTAEVKLFNKWSYDGVVVDDISLVDYLAIKQKFRYYNYLPHTAGRYNKKRFMKATCPIVERLVNAMMFHGRNNGKKLMASRIVNHAFEIIYLLTDKNPIQVLVDAIINSGPREDSTRIGSQGTVRRQAVDVSPFLPLELVKLPSEPSSLWPSALLMS